ncbi:MAG: ABC transporter permease subunit [Halobacteriaceae archaeon]
MRELAVHEARRRLRGSLVASGGIVALVALYVWIFPSVQSASVDLDEYVQAFPPALRELFGIRELGTIEGYLAAELYGFVWVMLLGLYLAAAAGSVVAADVEDGRMDLLLALPLTRARVLWGKSTALLVPVLVVNAVTPVAILAGVALLGESLSVADLLAVHALSVPYLACCGAIGLVFSVAVDRAAVAQRAAAGLVFGLFLVESVVIGTDLEPLAALAPSHYYEPSAVLVDGTYDLAGAGVLLAATAALVAVATLLFRRTDVT